MASSIDIVLLELGEMVLGLLWGNFGFMLSTYFLPFFFLPKGHGTDLSDVCFFPYIHHFEGIGDVLKS